MNEYPLFPFRRGGFGPGPMYLHNGGPHALAWATFALVLLLVLAFGALLVARAASGRPRRWHHRMAFAGPGDPQDPLELLRMRYARGEIDRNAFLQSTSDLTAAAPMEEKPSG